MWKLRRHGEDYRERDYQSESYAAAYSGYETARDLPAVWREWDSAQMSQERRERQCNNCHGSGRVRIWNSFREQWEERTCNRCGGTGKVKW